MNPGAEMNDSATVTPGHPKTVVREALDRMPENATFAEIVEQIQILAALEQSEREIRDGKLSDHAEVKERARQWRSR
jgi:hypothetical protein